MQMIRSIGAVLLVLAAGACLSIEQDPCEAGEALCVDGAVWVCRDDGSGWDEEIRCPGACEDGACVLDPLPSFDVEAGGADGGGADGGGADASPGDAGDDTVD